MEKRNLWPIRRILQVKPNKRDGLVWRVHLKTKSAVLEPPIDKIVLLEASRLLALVVQNVDNAIQRINHYPVDSVVCFVNTYPLDSDLSGG